MTRLAVLSMDLSQLSYPGLPAVRLSTAVAASRPPSSDAARSNGGDRSRFRCRTRTCPIGAQDTLGPCCAGAARVGHCCLPPVTPHSLASLWKPVGILCVSSQSSRLQPNIAAAQQKHIASGFRRVGPS